MRPRVAVILFNLGGPDRPEAIRPFLMNIFADPAILRVQFFVRWRVEPAHHGCYPRRHSPGLRRWNRTTLQIAVYGIAQAPAAIARSSI